MDSLAMGRLTPAQIRGARGMLGWSMVDLAKAADVSVSTVKRVENGGEVGVSAATVGLMRDALRQAGMEFLADVGGGPGLRLRPRQASPALRLV